MTHGRRGRVRRIYWGILAVVLTALGATCLVVWSAQTTTTAATATDAGHASGEVTPGPPRTPPPVLAGDTPGHPVGLRIPSLGLTTRLIELGLRKDGTVQVPRDAGVAGWFRLGPTPGAIGASVILGHVDSSAGPAVFFGLSEMQPGDLVVVRRDDGSTVRFEVRSVRTYPNDAFPAQRVYGNHGRSELNLVTCGGDYDAERGGYQSNVVVNALKV